MAKKEDSNIFDEAKRLSGKKKIAKKPSSSTDPKHSTKTRENWNVQDMLDHIHDMEDDLRKKMEGIYNLTGMSKKELENYISNPQNFTTSAWMKVQSQKEQLEKQVYDIVGIQEKKKALEKKKIQMNKQRKGKTLGGRKGWMPM